MTYVTHLECSMDGDHYAAGEIHNLSKAGKPLLVKYDLGRMKSELDRDALAMKPAGLWRYRDLLLCRRRRECRQPG